MRQAIGISGSHRTGKSTLCEEFSRLTGTPYVATSASGTFKRLKLDPQASYNFRQRLDIQAEILFDLEAIYKKAPPCFVTDRAPLDAAAYLLSEYNRSTLHEVADHEVSDYLDRCADLSAQYFAAYLIIQPGIPIKDDLSKAPALPAYMEHINSIVIGTALTTYTRHANISIVPQNMLSMSDRLQALSKISETVQKLFAQCVPYDQILPM